ncbi:hypothetical protein R5W24_000528 [Gemmata sp. JC717]|uniref:hypothetical protein n=1 Tax=Gemmata algarum TaxID=2975278 RepID=UPI0021BB2D01|nr:hypothetical protein [Gemmata algarum]MDY3551452.1 hypothetical protein [Gemmata algarum]
MRGKFEHLFKDGKPEEPPADDASDDSALLGDCASIRRAKPLTCLRVMLPGREEFLPYSHMGLNCIYEPHSRIAFEFSDLHYHKRLVIEGRNLEDLVLAISEHRTAWVRPAVRDTAADGQFIILKAEVVPVEQKR